MQLTYISMYSRFKIEKPQQNLFNTAKSSTNFSVVFKICGNNKPQLVWLSSHYSGHIHTQMSRMFQELLENIEFKLGKINEIYFIFVILSISLNLLKTGDHMYWWKTCYCAGTPYKSNWILEKDLKTLTSTNTNIEMKLVTYTN